MHKRHSGKMGRACERKQSTGCEDNGPDSAEEQAQALLDLIQRVARGAGAPVHSAGLAEGQSPLTRKPLHPSQALSHVPANRRPRNAPDRLVPGVNAVREQQVINGTCIPRSFQEAMRAPEAAR